MLTNAHPMPCAHPWSRHRCAAALHPTPWLPDLLHPRLPSPSEQVGVLASLGTIWRKFARTDRFWAIVARNLARKYNLYVPLTYRMGWKRLFWDQLFPSRYKWEPASSLKSKSQDYKIRVAARFRPVAERRLLGGASPRLASPGGALHRRCGPTPALHFSLLTTTPLPHAHTQRHAQTHTHTRTHARTHAHAHTHIPCARVPQGRARQRRAPRERCSSRRTSGCG